MGGLVRECCFLRRWGWPRPCRESSLEPDVPVVIQRAYDDGEQNIAWQCLPVKRLVVLGYGDIKGSGVGGECAIDSGIGLDHAEGVEQLLPDVVFGCILVCAVQELV